MDRKLKHIKQFTDAKAAIKLISNEILLINDYESLRKYLDLISSYFMKFANDETAPNKNILALQNFFRDNAKIKRDPEVIAKNAKAKRLSHKTTFKDYIDDYRVLRERGHSYRSIADYSEKYFKVKVSKDTIKKYLKELSNDTQ